MSVFLPELLAPAGNLDKFRTALLYGANAVYLGGTSGNLRAASGGLTFAELATAVNEAEAAGARVYYCLNSFAMQDDLPPLPEQIERAAEAGVHGFIIADPGVLRLARRHAPHVEVHLSTQANTMNAEAVAFWAEQGVSRVNLARELSARDIHAVRGACPDMELEVFVHGAQCLALSGQCLLSAFLNDRSGNKGRCTQPCRFEYRALACTESEKADAGKKINEWVKAGARAKGGVSEERTAVVEEFTRPGEALWEVSGGERFSSFWATRDLCLLPWLPWFVGNGINALKIEGRMKSAGYLAHTVDAYRSVLDALAVAAGQTEGPHQGANRAQSHAQRSFGGGCGVFAGRFSSALEELLIAATRALDTGFFLARRREISSEWVHARGLPARHDRNGAPVLPALGKKLLARVVAERAAGEWEVELYGNWECGADVELMLPGLRRPLLPSGAYGLENAKGERMGRLGNGTKGIVHVETADLRPGIFIRSAS